MALEISIVGVMTEEELGRELSSDVEDKRSFDDDFENEADFGEEYKDIEPFVFNALYYGFGGLVE
jgi:hypothetical protein